MAVRIHRLGRGLGLLASGLALWFGLGAPAVSAALPPSSAAAAVASRVGLTSGATGAIRSTAAFDRALAGDLHEAGGASSALVVDTDTGQTLYSSAPNTPRLPASVQKLFTSAAALFEFGSAGRLTTDVYGVGSVTDGVFSGTLYLKGGGDPTFGDRRFVHDFYGCGATVQTLLANLRAAGIRGIRGSIIGDPTIFDSRAGGPDSHYRAATETEGELSGLSYDAGWTTSAETALQPDPALWATRAFASVAKSEGIKVARGTKILTGITPTNARLLAHVASPSLSTLLTLTNAPSNNFFAETLDKDLGAYWGAGGSTAAGSATVQRVIATKLGLTERTNDGSGLSRYDRATATTVVELLEEMEPSRAFVDSLAVAGVSGTMIDEMLDSPAAGNCRGKTGTLHDVANLVGYCIAANGDHLVFAFLENHLVDSTLGHETEDLMGETLARYDADGTGVQSAPALPQPTAGAGVPTGTTGAGTPPSAPVTTTPTTATTPGTPTTPTSETGTTTTPSGGGGGL